MATQVQWRGGSTQEHATFTGAAREVTVDTEKKTLVVHDGSTAGGHPLLKKDQTNLPTSVTNGISVPTANNVAISTNGTKRLAIDATGFVELFDNDLYLTKTGLGNGQISFNGTTFSLTANSATAPIVFGKTSQEWMRITSDGKLGLGTSSVSDKLEISNGTTDEANALGIRSGRYLNSGQEGAQVKFYCDNTSSWLGTREIARIGSFGLDSDHRIGSLAFALKTTNSASNPTELMRLTPTGLGIGTTTVSDKLEIRGGAAVVGFSDNTTRTNKLFAGFGYETSGTLYGNCSIRSDYNNTNNSSTLNFHTAAGAGADIERARIDSSGRLLVGTTSGQGNSLLQVQGDASSASAEGVLYLRRGLATAAIGGNVGADLGRIQFGANDGTVAANIRCISDGTWGSTSDTPGALVFSTTADNDPTGPTERMRIRNDGKVLIGTTTVGFGSQSGFTIEPDSASYITASHPNGATSGSDYLVFGYNGSNIGSITQNGTTGVAYNTSSDYRLKENIAPLIGAIDRLIQIPVHRFNFISEPGKTVDGFLAHEAQAVVPECVTGEKDAVDDDGNPVYQGIDQSKLVPLLTAALQEALQKIETLEQRLNDAGIA